MAGPAARQAFDAIVAGRHPDLPLQVVDGGSHAALAAADAVLVASGTATLETALFKRPMVIVYKMAGLTALLMRRMGYLPWVGLPNILAREFLVPELLQEAATPGALADALMFQLDDARNRARLVERFGAMHESLRCDTGERAATAIAGLLASSRSTTRHRTEDGS